MADLRVAKKSEADNGPGGINAYDLDDILIPAFGPLEAFTRVLNEIPGDSRTLDAFDVASVIRALGEYGYNKALKDLSTLTEGMVHPESKGAANG